MSNYGLCGACGNEFVEVESYEPCGAVAYCKENSGLHVIQSDIFSFDNVPTIYDFMLKEYVHTTFPLKAKNKALEERVFQLNETVQELNDLEMNMSMYFNFYKKAVDKGDEEEMMRRESMYHEAGKDHQVICEQLLKNKTKEG